MKALNLKSMNWLMVLAMMCIVSFTSCSDDNEDGGPTAPIFPELKEINCGVGETAEISFEANLDWEISSNTSWCKFVNGEISESIMAGKAGKQTITIEVSADGQNYTEDAITEISLTMDKQSQVIYKVKRAKKEYQDLVITDEEGNVYDAEHPLTIKGNTLSTIYTNIKVQIEEGASVGFDAPEWLAYSIDEATETYQFTFNTENESGLDIKNSIPQGEYSLTFLTSDAETAQTDKIRKVTIPLIYEGLGEDVILINKTYMNAIISHDGQSITVGEESLNELVSTITTRNDEFEIVEFSQSFSTDGYIYDFSANGNLDWIISDKVNDKLTLTFNNNETENDREAVIMVFPKATYESIKDDLSGKIIKDGEIISEYSTNIVATLKQEKYVAPAAEITFETKYFAYIMESSTMLMPIDYEVTPEQQSSNTYKLTIPSADLASQYYYFSEEGETGGQVLFIEPVGMASNYTIEEENNDNAHGIVVLGNVLGEETLKKGWGIYFDNAATYNNDYEIVVKNGEEIVARCIIKIAK